MKIIDADGEELTLEVFDRMIEESHKSWRYKLIDKYFPKGFEGYNLSYQILHPWQFFKSCGRIINWAWQRVFRGYDDRIIWSIDGYLSRMIPLWVMQLKNNGIGFPMAMYNDEDLDEKNNYEASEDSTKKASDKWNAILDQIADGFESYSKIEEEYLYPNKPGFEDRYIELNNRYENGFNLLKEHFSDLWD
jgi:hypothetical protein